MKSCLLLPAVLAIAGCAAQPAFQRPPAAFPVLSNEQALIVVAELEAGESLPYLPPPECKQKAPGLQCVHVNLDPPPLWVRVKVQQTVYGPANLPDVLYAATTSHYGASTNKPGTQLVFLRTDGSQAIMQRYGHYPLLRKTDGSLHLPVEETRPSPWLQCAALELREEFAGGGEAHHAIDIRKLAGYLSQHAPSIQRINCK